MNDTHTFLYHICEWWAERTHTHLQFVEKHFKNNANSIFTHWKWRAAKENESQTKSHQMPSGQTTEHCVKMRLQQPDAWLWTLGFTRASLSQTLLWGPVKISPRVHANRPGGGSEGFGPRQRVELAVVFPTAGEIPQISSHCLSRYKKKCLGNNLQASTAGFTFRRLQVFWPQWVRRWCCLPPL